MKNLTIIISISILFLILLSAFENKSLSLFKQQTEAKAMFTEYITLNNNEVFKQPLYIQKNCLDFSSLTINTPSILIRSQETDIKYNDLLKIGIERVKNLSNGSFEDLYNCECSYGGGSENKILSSDAKFPYDVDACYYDRIQFSEQVWDEMYSKNRGTYYNINIKGEKFRSLLSKLLSNEISINWIMNDLIKIYNQVSNQYTDDWKYSMIQSLSELELFMKTFNQNKSNYKAIANNPKLKLQEKIGVNQAFLYRRIINDGISEKDAITFINKMKSAIKTSLKNGYSHYKDYIVNDGNLNISLKIIPKHGTNMITLSSKNSEKHIDFELGNISYIKCLKEDGKDYFLISDCNPSYCKESKPKQILVDENFNVLSNTY